jgi:hypothetical protein
MSLTVVQIGPKCISKVFPEVAGFIEQGLAPSNDINVNQAKDLISTGNWQLFAVFNEEKVINGAYVTTINNSPTGKIAVIISAAGKGLAGQEPFEQLCKIFKELGVTRVQALASDAAARLYRRVGLNKKAIFVEKKL